MKTSNRRRLACEAWGLAIAALCGCSAPPAANAPTPAPAVSGQRSSQAPAAPQSITGTVVETMDASNYTYVRIKSKTAEVWAAATQFKVAVGDRLTVPLENPMEDFESTSLKRTFPLIYFVSRLSRDGEPASPAAASLPPVNVEGAPGGMRVGDVWTRRQALSGKSITVRGTVVKFNGGILGRNWIHIQDGTGSSKEGTDDLTVTSDAVATVGTVITVTGNLAVDKDFGAGYAYPVIVERAAITSE